MTIKTETRTKEKKLNIIEQKMIEKVLTPCDIQALLFSKYKLSITRQAIKNWGKGSLPSPRYIKPICKILKIKPMDIFQSYMTKEN